MLPKLFYIFCTTNDKNGLNFYGREEPGPEQAARPSYVLSAHGIPSRESVQTASSGAPVALCGGGGKKGAVMWGGERGWGKAGT